MAFDLLAAEVFRIGGHSSEVSVCLVFFVMLYFIANLKKNNNNNNLYSLCIMIFVFITILGERGGGDV